MAKLLPVPAIVQSGKATAVLILIDAFCFNRRMLGQIKQLAFGE
jgi:hypothetical protein